MSVVNYPELLQVDHRAPWLVRYMIWLFSWLSPPLARRLIALLLIIPRRYPRPQREAERLESAERHKIHFEGKEVAVWRWRPSVSTQTLSTAPQLLLVHGWEGRGSQLAAVVPAMLARGWQVLAVDAPGHGESAGRSLSAPEYAAVLLQVERSFGSFSGIIAHSFGSIATTLALRQGLRCERLAFIGAGIWVDETLDRLGLIIGCSTKLVREALQLRARNEGINWRVLFADELYQEQSTPLLVIHDRGDREIPFSLVSRLQAAWPTSELKATEGLGHRRILRAPEVTSALETWFCRE
ncbi:MAG: alpha/beta hydrolase [Myxococcota bacterium]|nr:alpha/beta hydrolase [Myxococcota bacterium]